MLVKHLKLTKGWAVVEVSVAYKFCIVSQVVVQMQLCTEPCPCIHVDILLYHQAIALQATVAE